MIAPPGVLNKDRHSTDGLVETGLATIGNLHYAYAHLGPGELSIQDLKALISFLEKLPVERPLLLLSCCPGFSLSIDEEAQGRVFEAGAIRALQQQRKTNGGLILSYHYQVIVGGIYLLHGLSAHYRAAAPDTLFYDTVPGRPAVPLELALQRGLLDEIVSPDALESWLLSAVARFSAQAQP